MRNTTALGCSRVLAQSAQVRSLQRWQLSMVSANHSDHATNPNGNVDSSEWCNVQLGVRRPAYMGCTCAWSLGIGRDVTEQVTKSCNRSTYSLDNMPITST
jgi:hypothetical protein